MKKELVLASHGELALGMKNTLEMIIGDIPIVCTAYTLLPGHHPDEFVAQLEERIKNSSDTEFNIIVDLYGASVCTSLARLTVFPNINLFSGMNLNLVLSIVLEHLDCITNEDIIEIINMAKLGIQHIQLCENQVDDF